jgi:muramoyltetrapeptide carboxypeptidase
MPITYPRATAGGNWKSKMALFGKPLRYEIALTLWTDLEPHLELVGGNLSILYSLLGSTSAIDCTDKILFIEDEYLYHIDRMMI